MLNITKFLIDRVENIIVHNTTVSVQCAKLNAGLCFPDISLLEGQYS